MSLALYWLTLAPDLVWQDQGDYQVQVAQCHLNRPGDVVRVHPLYLVLAHGIGRVTPWSYAYAANWTSALCAAILNANVFVLVRGLVRCSVPAILAAALCGLSYSVWFFAVQAQTYHLANALWTGSLVCALGYQQRQKPLYLSAMGLLGGLGFSAHILSQIGVAVLFAWLLYGCLRRRLSWLTAVGVFFCWFVGAALVWVAVGIEYQRSGDLGAALASAIVGKWGSAVFNVDQLGHLLLRSGQFFVLNFPTPLVLLALPGIVYSFKKPENRMLGVILAASAVLYFLFAVRYDVPNMNNFFLPFYILMTIYVGLGLGAIPTRSRKGVGVAAVLCLLALAPTYVGLARVAEARQIPLGTRRSIPYRNVYTYYLIPWQQDQTGPRRLATELVRILPEGAVVLPDSTTLPALQYVYFIEHQRPDWHVDTIFRPAEQIQSWLQAGRRVFTLSEVKGYYPPDLPETCQLVPFRISNTEHIFEIQCSSPS